MSFKDGKAPPGEDESAAERDDSIGSEEIRRQLQRILNSRDFDTTERNRRFLAYVVDESLAERSDRIKAYSIAVEVFGRDASFDPQTDPIVRVEAGQLRRALDRYYLGAGRDDPIMVAIPKGGYAPQFRRNTAAAPAGPEVSPPSRAEAARSRLRPVAAAVACGLVLAAIFAAWAYLGRADQPIQPDLPRLLVQRFDDISDPGHSTLIAEGFTQEIIGQIAKFRDIVVISAGPDGNPLTPIPPGAPNSPRYVLAGLVDIDDQKVRLQARLLSRADGAVLWANTYSEDLSVSHLIEIEHDIANQVATALAQPYGAISQADASRPMVSIPEDWAAYACTLSYYSYRLSLDPATHSQVRECLKEAVARSPTYATAWGLLSQIYIDELRFRFAPDPQDGAASVDRALAAARKAVALDPMNIRGLQAEMLALYFAGEMDAAIDVGKQALSINPNDTELMGEVGFRMALAGDWGAGCALVAEARQRNPGPAGYYESALSLCSYIRGDLKQASTLIRKAPLPNNPQYHLIAAVIYGESGDPASAAEIDWIRQNAPHLYGEAEVRKELAYRIGRQEDVDRFVKSLVKAGLPSAN